MHYQEENNFPKALAYSTGLMALLILISYFIIFGMASPPLEPGVGGIIVNYGTAEEGMGDDFTSIEEPSVAPNANQTAPDKVIPDPQTTSDPVSETSDKAIVTQNTEDAPTITTSKKSTTSTPSTSPVKADAKPTVNENAIYRGKKNNGTGEGDGTGSTPGNQGDVDGTTMTSVYGKGGSGFGDIKVANRIAVKKPQVEDMGQSVGKIIIRIKVDKNGEVIYAQYDRGSKFTDFKLLEKCLRAVRATRFNSSETAPEIQEGTITFNFKVQ
ncbi:MAG: energy transducer TonB [Sphingobacteriaceae bacterium]|nr:energy transducer TonB [Sphingobacteriaceae bacterium]